MLKPRKALYQRIFEIRWTAPTDARIEASNVSYCRDAIVRIAWEVTRVTLLAVLAGRE